MASYRLVENARLDARNTFGVPARASLLVEVSDTAALPELFGYPMLRDGPLLVLGGGYVGCEFASIFNGLGAQVTQVQRSAHLLNRAHSAGRDQVASGQVGPGGDAVGEIAAGVGVQRAGPGVEHEVRVAELASWPMDGGIAKW